MPRKKKANEEGQANWLTTYSDMVTLLLTFFILLYAMSTVDANKWVKIVEAFSDGKNVITAPDNLPPGDKLIDSGSTEDSPAIEEEDSDGLDVLYHMLSTYVDENKLDSDVELYKSEQFVFIRFTNNVFFDGYSAILKNSGEKILDVLAGGIKKADVYIEEIIIAGHTAEVEDDMNQIDRKLSSERADNVLLYLESKNVTYPGKYVSVGYGLYRPIAPNISSEGRAANRRVEIFISRKGYPVGFTEHIYDIINSDDKIISNVKKKE